MKAWGDTSCPVCRYCSHGAAGATSRCDACGTGANLWICLICGHVGCGRYKSGHASDHWKESGHCFALELETQRVWDYAGARRRASLPVQKRAPPPPPPSFRTQSTPPPGDGYVHRLIQSKTDGKLVEVPSPAPACGHSGRRRGSMPCGSGGGGGGGGYGGGGYGGDEEGCPECSHEAELKEAMVSSKLDAIAFEYNHLLTSQLDSQRQYFEGLLDKARADADARAGAAERAAAASAAGGAEAAGAAREAERKRAALERKLVRGGAAAARARAAAPSPPPTPPRRSHTPPRHAPRPRLPTHPTPRAPPAPAQAEAQAAAAKLGEERAFLRSLNETLLANQKARGRAAPRPARRRPARRRPLGARAPPRRAAPACRAAPRAAPTPRADRRAPRPSPRPPGVCREAARGGGRGGGEQRADSRPPGAGARGEGRP